MSENSSTDAAVCMVSLWQAVRIWCRCLPRIQMSVLGGPMSELVLVEGVDGLFRIVIQCGGVFCPLLKD